MFVTFQPFYYNFFFFSWSGHYFVLTDLKKHPMLQENNFFSIEIWEDPMMLKINGARQLSKSKILDNGLGIDSQCFCISTFTMIHNVWSDFYIFNWILYGQVTLYETCLTNGAQGYLGKTWGLDIHECFFLNTTQRVANKWEDLNMCCRQELINRVAWL